jgi:ketosteroid isomerase-like protein
MNTTTFQDLAERLERQRWLLMLHGPADELARVLSDDLIYVHSNGLIDDRKSYLEKYRDGTFLYHRIEGRIEQVIVLGSDALAVSGVSDMEVTVKGVSKRIKSISLVIWRRDDDVWRLVAHQNTLMPDNS